ncbi:O-antigen ligase family protein [Enterobacter hormaechei]|nr:O-antigen ligase family protein [Enterobacter hormaechei]
MEKIKPRLYQLTIALSLISLILALVSSGKQREFFYIAIYASIIGLAFEYKKITLRPFTIALPILLIGLLNLGWYLLYEYHNEGLNLYSDYLGASKKLILASVLIFYIDRFKFYIDKDTFRKFFFFATALGFVLATGYGLWQASQGMTRVEMAINRATVSAYVYSVLSLAFVYSLYLQQNVKLYVVAGFTILISYFVILLTGTRAAMGLYLLLAIVLTLYHFRKIHLKSALIFLCIVAGVVIVSSALEYIKVHLHNEFIEKYSLQGIPGVAVMLFFFVSMIVYALRNRNALLLTSMLLLLLYGLTDVILLSSEALIFFMILFALSTPFSQTKQQ